MSRSLYKAVQTAREQETLIRVTVWCIGEYGEMLVNNSGVLDIEDPNTVTEADAVDVVETAIGRHSSDLTTQAMCLISLLKLSSHFPSCSKSSLVERMPVLDEATYSGRKAGSVSPSVLTSQGAPLKLPNGVAKPTSVPLIDLLDISSDDIPAANPSDGNFLQDLLVVDLSPASSQQGTNQIQKSGTDVLLDLLSIGTPPAQSSSPALDILSSGRNGKSSVDLLDKLASPSAQASTPLGSSSVMNLLDGFGSNPSVPVGKVNGPTYPSIVAFESSSLKATFSFSKESGNPQTTVIEAQFINKSPNIFSNFLFQAAVPKFLQLQLEPASSITLPASGNGSITQKLRVSNSKQGKKSLIMRIRISYKVNDKYILEEGQISNFPRDL